MATHGNCSRLEGMSCGAKMKKPDERSLHFVLFGTLGATCGMKKRVRTIATSESCHRANAIDFAAGSAVHDLLF